MTHTKLIFTFLLFILLSTNLFAQVTQEWVARYNGPGSGSDGASSIAVDDSGNVYVTGSSEGDYLTIKYNSTGVQQWIQRYNGTGNGTDGASSIAVDDSGNAYVTGTSVGSGTYHDYLTIKYNSAGVQQWVSRYNGPENSSDVAHTIGVDGSGNVYVTGFSWVGGVTGNDYLTIKYNSAGVQQWVQTYDGDNWVDIAFSLALDNSGNVYVTGYSDFDYYKYIDSDYLTIKYNTSGIQQWVRRYNGPSTWFSDDKARSIVIDSSGNVYVTGHSVGNEDSHDYATIKYNNSGTQQWISRYDGPDGWGVPGIVTESATSIAVDSYGNVYVTGFSRGSGINYDVDYVTVKYNTSGTQQWVQRYNGPGNGHDIATSIALDDFGDVYVTGSSVGSGASTDSTDWATIKYNSEGVQQWISRYNGPGNSYDGASSLVLDGSGNVYVTGSSTGIGTGSDYATIKYSQPLPVAPLLLSPANNAIGQTLNLSLVWNSVEFASKYKLQLASDTSFTNIILDDSTLTDTVKAVTNLSPLTDYYWRVNAKNISGTGPFSSVWHFKTLGSPMQVNLLYPPDDTTNIPVNVNFIWNKPGEQTSSIKTLKRNLLDNPVISKYWFELNTDTTGAPLIIDSTLTDTTKLVSGLNNLISYYWRVKAENETGWGVYSLWFKFTTVSPPPLAPVLVSPQNGALLVETNPLLDWDSSIYAESYRVQVATDSVFTSSVYDSSGIIITEFQIPNNGLNINTTYYWRVNASNVTGTSPWSLIFHFTTGVTNITHNNEVPKEFKLYNSYPNPFNPSTKIKFDIPKSSYVKLIVYDVLGREIKTLVNEKLIAGRYEVSWDGSGYTSGVYIYKLVAGDFVNVKKMVLLK